MGAMDARRLELYELLKPKLDEEPARALVLALPADPDNLATKDQLVGIERQLQEFRSEFKNEIVGSETRIKQYVETRLAQTDATLTRRMVAIMGSWTILVGSTVGWLVVLFR
jgi:hypothetical protein